MAGYDIPFNVPAIVGDEFDYMRRAVEGGHASSGGPYSRACADILRDAHGAADVLLTTSCTDALEMAALLLEIEPGDKVIIPSFTFVSTALAFVRAGARIAFADIEPETLGVDPASVDRLLDDDVKAVVPVHYAGVGCDMEGLEAALAGRPDVAVVEDNAHGLFGAIGDRPLGTFGRFSTLSFHETKNFVCGEGGALVVNDATDVDRAHTLLDKGTNRRQFLLGQVDKYSWQDIGSSFGLSDVLAAYLLAQLERRESVQERREAIFERYRAHLEPHVGTTGIRLPVVPEDRSCAYHMFYVLMPDRESRDRMLRHLASESILGTFHYVPLHSAEGGRRFSADHTECPVTDDVSGRLIRLPFFNALRDDQIDRIVETFLAATLT